MGASAEFGRSSGMFADEHDASAASVTRATTSRPARKIMDRAYGQIPQPEPAAPNRRAFARVARALAPHGDRGLAQPLPVPGNLEELVASRVATLSAPARQLALAAAATSQPTPSVLTSALPADADFGAALLESEEAGVLTSEDGRIRFEHPLHASVIYGSASAERRRRLHKRLLTRPPPGGFGQGDESE
jgi:hypothetical protein